MFQWIYGICFILSVLIMVGVATQRYRYIGTYFWSIAVFVSFICFGYYARASATNLAAAQTANRLLMLDNYVLPLMMVFATYKKAKINVSGWFIGVFYALALGCTFLCWTQGFADWYYKDMQIILTDKGTLVTFEEGPLIVVHYIYIAMYAVSMTGVLVYSYIKRAKISFANIARYYSVCVLWALAYLLWKVGATDFDLYPIVYIIADIILFWTYLHDEVYELDSIVTTMHENSTRTGYIAFDLHGRFLGANDTAQRIFPDISKLSIGHRVPESFEEVHSRLLNWISNYDSGDRAPRCFEFEKQVYEYKLSVFYSSRGGKPGGYLFSIADDTDKQNYLSFVNNYNETLHDEVDKQTKVIGQIQDKVVLGLANMIENRDENTGGHVKRTSDVIKILVDTMMENRIGDLNKKYANDIIRSAPMHDLGKIAIDNSILCKPGRLTDEEYELMKTHPVKSSEIVLSILHGVEEQHFVDVAYNVARHHHERYDGKGYPDGLSGTDIPFEARIMAIADVYDALVSKRCYKDPMSFEKAYEVMMENMGSQFDPGLEIVFEIDRPKLEEYFSRS